MVCLFGRRRKKAIRSWLIEHRQRNRAYADKVYDLPDNGSSALKAALVTLFNVEL